MSGFSGNRMDGKVCVVTGATQGLGAAIAHRLAAAGAAGVVVTGRNVTNGQAVANTLGQTCPALFVRADLGNPDDCARVIADTDHRFGRVDVLVNAGASTARGTILDTSPEGFDAMFATNVRGPFFMMQAALRLMIRDGIKGAICNIGSTSALAGQPFISAYCASKGALSTLTANTAFAVMANRIRVNQLNPGWMSTDNERAMQLVEGGDPDWEAKASARLPFGRLIDPAEVARAVNFLVSDDAGLMTGAIVNLDQGVWGAFPGGPPVPKGPMVL
jgi:NAD(P)-dependent dehydrogenase (short-subunit alcohol dehydrogenase family)